MEYNYKLTLVKDDKGGVVIGRDHYRIERRGELRPVEESGSADSTIKANLKYYAEQRVLHEKKKNKEAPNMLELTLTVKI